MPSLVLLMQGMHLFEALTILLAGQLSLALAVIGGRVPRAVSLLPAACLAPLALHLAFEGPRWQMVPAYLAVVALCVFGGLRWRGPAAQGSAGGPAGGPAAGAASGGVLARLLGAGGFFLLMASLALGMAFSR
jgi:hypothetical protein